MDAESKPGTPRAYAATINDQEMNTRQFLRMIPAIQKKLAERQKRFRHTSGEYRRIQKDLDALANARYFDTLTYPGGTRLEVYAKAAGVIERNE